MHPSTLVWHPVTCAVLVCCPVLAAGGNCNVVKEIIYPLGAEIDVRAVKVCHLP
jgi:hypothetical protein